MSTRVLFRFFRGSVLLIILVFCVVFFVLFVFVLCLVCTILPVSPDCQLLIRLGGMVFNAIFNNISVYIMVVRFIGGETGVPWEYHRPATSHWQTLSHNVVSSTPLLSGIRIQIPDCPFDFLYRLLTHSVVKGNCCYNNKSSFTLHICCI